MLLGEAQDKAWLQLPQPPQTLADALAPLRLRVQAAGDALAAEQAVRCQTALEDALVSLLVAFKALGLDAEQALLRGLSRQAGDLRQTKVFRVFENRVELWVGDEYRGG